MNKRRKRQRKGISLSKKKDGLDFHRRRKRIELTRFKRAGLLLLEMALVLALSYIVVFTFGIRVDILGNSMEPTLYEGDGVLLNKLSYKIGSPHHNDVVMFRPAGNLNAQYSIKRVIGVPGDTVLIFNGRVYINGEQYRDVTETDAIIEAGRAEEEFTLGPDEYFLLGDNRNSSEDSRYETIGNVSTADMLGRLWFNTKRERFGFIK